MAGDVTVTDSNGTVDLTSVALGDVAVNDRSGSVTVTVPGGAGFNVEARTTEGDVSNEFGLVASEQNERKSLNGKVGSGTPR